MPSKRAPKADTAKPAGQQDPPVSDENLNTFAADVLQHCHENFYSAYVGYMEDEKGYDRKFLKALERALYKRDGRT